jgi:2-polyprenyl-6-methoxyphenol hydroxylase-like FAD-dependent oxidoreductase
MTRQVLICGAGPVGLTLAIELTRFGVPVRIIDKSATRTDKSKALVLWSRTLELFEGSGLTQTFLPIGNKVHSAQTISGGKLIASVDLSLVKDTPYPYALMIPQSETERILEDHLATLGVTVERSTEMTAFSESEGKIVASMRSKGAEQTSEVEWLVGCDGAHSVVRHGLGFEFTGTTEPSDWALADLHLTGTVSPDVLRIYWHSEGMLALFPMGSERYRVIANLSALEGGARPDPTLEEIQHLIDRRGPQGVVASRPVWLSNFHINERKVKDYRRGNVMLAGDAAHVHSPAGGQGMNTGMQDAFNLAWKLAMVWDGRAPDTLLETYSTERSAVGDTVLRNATRLTTAVALQNPVAQMLRNTLAHFILGFSKVQEAGARTLTEVDIAYPDSPLTVASASETRSNHPKAGQRVPAGFEGTTQGEIGLAAKFTVTGSARDVQALLADFPALVSASLASVSSEPRLRIIRPDGYVGLLADAGDLDAARRYFNRFELKRSVQSTEICK